MKTIIHLVLCTNMIHTAVLTPDGIRKHHLLTGLKSLPASRYAFQTCRPIAKKQAATV
jgi:hypothetical protein